MSLNYLASDLQAQGDLAAARPLAERALAICEKVLDRDHPDTAWILANLASIRCRSARPFAGIPQ
jgi:hypothetical protein